MARHKRKKPIYLPTEEDVQDMLDVMPDSPTGHRNKALLMVLVKSGIRVSEMCDLRPVDLDIEHGRMYVRYGKNGYDRWVKLFDTEGYLDRWLSYRATLGLRDSEPLLCCISKNKVGKKVSRFYVAQMLKRVSINAGIEHRIHAHAFRHLLAHRLIMKNVPILAIKEQLGHQNVWITEEYLNSLGGGRALSLLDDIDL